jgi:hypothetical protein
VCTLARALSNGRAPLSARACAPQPRKKKTHPPPSLSPPHPQSRARSFLVRLGSTIVLIATFAGIIYLGHVPLAIMILGIQTLMVRELYALADTSPTFGGPASRASAALRWYTFGVAAFWIYTRFCRRQLAVEAVSLLRGGEAAAGGGGGLAAQAASAVVETNRGAVAGLLGWLVRRHNLAAFMLYTAGELFGGVFLRVWAGGRVFFFGRGGRLPGPGSTFSHPIPSHPISLPHTHASP